MTGDESFAARGVSNPLGKLTAELKVWLPEGVKDDLTMLAVLNRQSVSEYVRDLCMLHTHGAAEMTRLRSRLGHGRDISGTET